MPCQTKHSETALVVGLGPTSARPCTDGKTSFLRERGTKDRGKPPGYITKEVIAIDVEILEL